MTRQREPRKRDHAEEWRAVAGYEGRYEVSDHGRVRSLKRVEIDRIGRRKPISGQLLKPSKATTGYLVVSLGGRTHAVHVLVAKTFIGPRPAGHEVLHGDDNKGNPALWNLDYGTPLKNMADAVARGRLVRGEARESSKLTDERVMAARALVPEYATQVRVARAFGVSTPTIRKVIGRHAREGWSHVVRGLPVAEALRVLLVAERAEMIRHALPFMVAVLERRRASTRA